MSTLNIQERFSLDDAPELVWAYLIDPVRTVVCLPGAEITGQDDDGTYSGAMKVKVGAVTVSYRGNLNFEEIDEARGYFRMVGKGREKSGSGSVTMTMEGRLLALDDGGSEIVVDSEVRLTGKIVRFGRGMIESISGEIFKEFTVRLADELRRETQADGEGSDAAATAEAGPGTGEGTAQEPALNLVPLLLRAFRAWLSRLFGGS